MPLTKIEHEQLLTSIRLLETHGGINGDPIVRRGQVARLIELYTEKFLGITKDVEIDKVQIREE